MDHENVTMGWSDKVKFLYRFIQSPKQIGSVTPSSRFLTKQMLIPVDWSRVRAVAELGPGTGVFTRSIIEQMKQSDHNGQLLLFEQDDNLRRLLLAKFPGVACFKEALELAQAMDDFGLTQVDAVISGLPFANFTQDKREQIIHAVKNSLTPDGTFIMFQYSLQMKSLLERMFPNVQLHFVPLNIPPAFVYVCRK